VARHRGGESRRCNATGARRGTACSGVTRIALMPERELLRGRP
jgi:hypothetical protein